MRAIDLVSGANDERHCHMQDADAHAEAKEGEAHARSKSDTEPIARILTDAELVVRCEILKVGFWPDLNHFHYFMYYVSFVSRAGICNACHICIP